MRQLTASCIEGSRDFLEHLPCVSPPYWKSSQLKRDYFAAE
jgi:hypothetical protein